ncbi:MAG: sigma factor, partial [Syntrophales bacterium]|nr:sigma factor [Syntrophales bacterium]
MGEKKGTRSESDDEIVRQVRNGNRDAFAQLLERYGDYIMRLVRRHVPQDQVEETAHLAFVRAYQSLDNFKKMGAFKQWL